MGERGGHGVSSPDGGGGSAAAAGWFVSEGVARQGRE
jgi:hypothetical protein